MLRDEIEQYRQSDGLISPDRHPTPDSTGNGLLYLSLYHILLHRLGESSFNDRFKFSLIVDRCSQEPGLLRRSPTKRDQNGPDDYIGVCYASRLLQTTHLERIRHYGDTHSYIYNNDRPGRFSRQSWFGRMRFFVAHVQYCARKKSSWFDALMWELSLLLGTFKLDSYNDAMLQWICVEARGFSSFITRLWEREFNKHWPGGMKQVLCAHLGESHAIAKYWR